MRIKRLLMATMLTAMIIPQTAFAAGSTVSSSIGSSTTTVSIPASSASSSATAANKETAAEPGTIYRTTIENNIQMGQVAIELTQTELRGNKEVTAVKNEMVVPGQIVSKINHIRNLGNEAWIRAKVVFNTKDEETDKILNLTDDVIILHDAEKWKKYGDYYYYTDPMPQGAETIFIDGYKIPKEWGDETADLTFEAKVTVDAVQTKNFTPDFSGKDPWFGTLIEQRVYEPFTIQKGTTASFQVVFKDGAEGLIHVGDDFFSGFGTVMPGDSLSGKATVMNNYSQPVTIYFETAFSDGKELADEADLIIKNGTQTIYSGKLSGSLTRIPLGTYKKGESSELSFTLNIPKELQNKFALSKAKVVWTFSCEVQEEEKPAIPSLPIQIIQNNFMGGPGGKGGAGTGDASHLGLYAAGLCVTCGILAVVVVAKKRGEKKTA